MTRTERGSFSILRNYIIREFLLAFCVSFIFFFFIFFINQILLLVQRVLLRNVSILNMLRLVLFSVPQFLLYTFPFSSLTAASMVMGDLASKNEILALRSLGFPLRRVFFPIVAVSLVISVLSFAVADVVLPWSTVQFQDSYRSIMSELPTVEMDSYGVNKIGDIIISNGAVRQDGVVEDIVIIDRGSDSRVMQAEEGELGVEDIFSYTYRLQMKNPSIFTSTGSSIDSYNLATADSALYYLNLDAGQVTSLQAITPSQLSTKDLWDAVVIRKQTLQDQKAANQIDALSKLNEASQSLRTLDFEGNLMTEQQIKQIIIHEQESLTLSQEKPINYYYQYYLSELHKKIALSFACTVLVFVAFPLSFFRVKHGRLIGFGISMFIACLYWFMLFFSQLQVVDYPLNPALFMWLPNLIILGISALLLVRLRRT